MPRYEVVGFGRETGRKREVEMKDIKFIVLLSLITAIGLTSIIWLVTLQIKYNSLSSVEASNELKDLQRKESEAAKATVDYAKNFSETIGDWLGVEQIDKAYAAMSRLVKENPSVGYTRGLAILKAYAAGRNHPVVNPEIELMKAMEVVRMTAPLTYGEEETARLMGQLEEIMPEKTMDDLADIAILIRKRAAQHKDQIEECMGVVHQMVAMGIPPEKALGTMMAAFEEGGQAGKAMTEMVDLIGKLKDPNKQ